MLLILNQLDQAVETHTTTLSGSVTSATLLKSMGHNGVIMNNYSISHIMGKVVKILNKITKLMVFNGMLLCRTAQKQLLAI